ncbi:MAG: type II toxin-antitoxin system RelE/ParE family toxin [Cyclobacteriaceae bacterium]|nr:type II toxin-antitoxin system RelE/ParE family toxin [Cyclobacteriaceae bacterium]
MRAVDSLNKFCELIALDSPSASKKVRKEIILSAGKLATHAEMYQLDELFEDPGLNIRRFFRWNYKIVYQVHAKEVVILNIFHTRTNLSDKD